MKSHRDQRGRTRHRELLQQQTRVESKEVPPQGQTLQNTGQGLEGSTRLVLRCSLGTWQGQPAELSRVTLGVREL